MNISWTIASQRQLIKLRKMYYKSLLEQELIWYDKNKPEEICGDMYEQTKRAQTTLVESVTSMLTCLSMSIGSIIVSFFLGWRLALVLNAYIPVVVTLNYVRSRYNVKAKNATSDLTVKLNGGVFEVFENIKTVKYLNG
jgi:ATP-binding cassette, subfamily B (MDR/TAP), member 1